MDNGTDVVIKFPSVGSNGIFCRCFSHRNHNTRFVLEKIFHLSFLPFPILIFTSEDGHFSLFTIHLRNDSKSR
jgi:hypothetical protein